MDSFAYQPSRKKRGGPHHGYRPRSARMRHGSRKSAAQLRALAAPPRAEARAELRAALLTAVSA